MVMVPGGFILTHTHWKVVSGNSLRRVCAGGALKKGRFSAVPTGCGSKIGTQKGTLVSGNMD